MEAVLKNVASTTELLAVAEHSVEVEQWDKQTVLRAFQWARYCEHAYHRFAHNSTIRRLTEKQLQVTNQSLQAAFPAYMAVSFSDLGWCQYLLLVKLLNNPFLPSSILKMFFDTQSEDEDMTGFCSHIIEYKSACKVLNPVIDSLASSSALGADAEVQGAMLMARLHALLDQGHEACGAEHFLDSVLQGCEGTEEHFCLVIAAALLTGNNLAAENASEDFLLDWLQHKRSLLQRLCCALPTAHLMQLAKEHGKFRVLYSDVLKKWASAMEYSITEGEWVQIGMNSTVSFEELTQRFLALFEVCPSLREDVQKELKALKASDGDFDVRGLSVWGDLLSQINK
ncbi:Fanconi anemia group F protein [Thalassophryne amazonica]|uniref:Fanconi anemia group F protein n=1 Tax=Thalassophryne amazonica TaxID=390379 RepID=UPI001471C289|nr:Fanconi anemia group F protein [Thalassophryne amazonica]